MSPPAGQRVSTPSQKWRKKNGLSVEVLPPIKSSTRNSISVAACPTSPTSAFEVAFRRRSSIFSASMESIFFSFSNRCNIAMLRRRYKTSSSRVTRACSAFLTLTLARFSLCNERYFLASIMSTSVAANELVSEWTTLCTIESRSLEADIIRLSTSSSVS